MIARGLLLVMAFVLESWPLRAETLVTALSTERVSIESNFTGSGVVIFGTVERDQQTVARGAPYEIVVTLTGPLRSMMARRKERVAGIWINRTSSELPRVPSFLAIATTAPMADVAGNPVRARQGLGFDMLPTRGLPDALPPVRTEFDAAFFRLMQKEACSASTREVSNSCRRSCSEHRSLCPPTSRSAGTRPPSTCFPAAYCSPRRRRIFPS